MAIDDRRRVFEARKAEETTKVILYHRSQGCLAGWGQPSHERVSYIANGPWVSHPTPRSSGLRGPHRRKNVI